MGGVRARGARLIRLILVAVLTGAAASAFGSLAHVGLSPDRPTISTALVDATACGALLVGKPDHPGGCANAAPRTQHAIFATATAANGLRRASVVGAFHAVPIKDLNVGTAAERAPPR